MPKKLIVLVVLLLASLPYSAFAQSVDTAWVRRYNGVGGGWNVPYNMAVDGSGNVYVTGTVQVGVEQHYATVKYLPDGDTAWARLYNGPSGWDFPYGLALDGSGNVIVTGFIMMPVGWPYSFDCATVKYSSAGAELWDRIYDESTDSLWDLSMAVAVDASDNIYVTGPSQGDGTNWDFATIKYSAGGSRAWVRRYDGGHGSDGANAIAVDGSNNVIVAGMSSGSGTLGDYFTIKYSSGGSRIWEKRYNGPASGSDDVHAVVVDDSDNVYVTGESEGDGTESDYATIKYYSGGDTAWVRRYDGPGSSWDRAHGIAVDASGNVYVTGASYGDGTSFDYATVKYDSSGNELWVRRYGDADYDTAAAIALDASGNVYVTGRSGSDFATLKYLPDGTVAWVKKYTLGGMQDGACAIAVDDSGNVYVTGQGGIDYVTIKYRLLPFQYGDATGDGVINIGDVVYVVNYLYKNGDPPDPIELGDANCDGVVNVGDVVYLINYLYKGGLPPCSD